MAKMREQTRFAVQFYIRKYVDYVNNIDGGISRRGHVTADRTADENNNRKQSASTRKEVHENRGNELNKNSGKRDDRDFEDHMEDENDFDGALDPFYES